MSAADYTDGVREGNRLAQMHLAGWAGCGGYELHYRQEARTAAAGPYRREAVYRYGLVRAYREAVRTGARGHDFVETTTTGGSR